MATKKPVMPKVGDESQQREFNSRTMTVGNIRTANYPPVKTSGVVTLGNGAATKGKTARGPMA